MRTGAADVSGQAALALLLPMEAGIPIPLPAAGLCVAGWPAPWRGQRLILCVAW
jgi:hypothetical protein